MYHPKELLHEGYVKHDHLCFPILGSNTKPGSKRKKRDISTFVRFEPSNRTWPTPIPYAVSTTFSGMNRTPFRLLTQGASDQ